MAKGWISARTSGLATKYNSSDGPSNGGSADATAVILRRADVREIKPLPRDSIVPAATEPKGRSAHLAVAPCSSPDGPGTLPVA